MADVPHYLNILNALVYCSALYKECLEAETKFCGKAMYWNFYQTNQDNLNISCKYDYDGLLININQIINPNNFEVPIDIS